MARNRPGLGIEWEAQAEAEGLGPVAGVDEVGRGPLAGPVVAAAVILDRACVPAGLGDSKTIPEPRREALSAAILACARAVAIGMASPEEIDRLNIRVATHLAMQRAVAGLALAPGLILVDGRETAGFRDPVRAIVRGDGLVASIAAASIVAKVSRDRLMRRLGEDFPVYGFGVNAGYGTPQHRAALHTHGPCPFHRFGFAPLKGRWTRG